MHREAEAVIVRSEKLAAYPVTIPRHDPVKRIYVLMVKSIIEREE